MFIYYAQNFILIMNDSALNRNCRYFLRMAPLSHNCFDITDAEKSLECDFESSYACGYEPFVQGRIVWERSNVRDGQEHLSPSLDASGSSKGKLHIM